MMLTVKIRVIEITGEIRETVVDRAMGRPEPPTEAPHNQAAVAIMALR
jgi:hypothetical protein